MNKRAGRKSNRHIIRQYQVTVRITSVRSQKRQQLAQVTIKRHQSFVLLAVFEGNPPVPDSQRASQDAENFSTSWRHQVMSFRYYQNRAYFTIERFDCHILPLVHCNTCKLVIVTYQHTPGARPTKHISIEFEIRLKFRMLYFRIYWTGHNDIVHTSRQWHCRDVCKN